MLKLIAVTALIGAIVFHVNAVFAKDESEEIAQIACPTGTPVYKPHPAYRPRQHEFTLTVEDPPEDEKTTANLKYYIVHAFEGQKEVSNYKMVMMCGNGGAGCYIGGHEFLQFNREFDVDWEDDPYALLISGMGDFARPIKNLDNFNFLTNEKVVPDFRGLNLWILSGCKQ